MNVQKHSGLGVTVTGLKELLYVVNELERANIGTGPLFRMIGARLRKIQRKHFREKQQFDGTPWPPLSPTTIARRRKGKKKGARVQILKDTGRLFTSISWVSTKYSATVGTNVEDKKGRSYGKAHQYGKNVPKREYIFLRVSDTEILISMLTSKLIRKPLGLN